MQAHQKEIEAALMINLIVDAKSINFLIQFATNVFSDITVRRSRLFICNNSTTKRDLLN